MRNTYWRRKGLAALMTLLLSFVFAGVGLASTEERGQIRGVVQGPAGLPLAAAKIVTVGKASGKVVTAWADSDGAFLVGPLPRDEYLLSVEHDGFVLFEESLELESGEEVRRRVVLDLEGFSGSVVVESEPGNFVLDAEEIERLQAMDASQLLSQESMVAVGGAVPVAQKIYVRGFEDVLLNVTIDGAQQAGELYHHQGRVQIEPELLKSIELEAGAGPATSGAGALTGALRLTTKSAFDLLEPGRDYGGRVKASRGFTGEDSLSVTASAWARISHNLALLVSGVDRDVSNYEDGNGDLVEPSAADQERGLTKVSGQFTNHSFDLSYEKANDSGTYYERPNLTNFTGRYILSDHEMNRDTATYNHRYDPTSDRIRLKATAYWTRSDYSNSRNTTGALYGEGEFSSQGLDLRNTSVLDDHILTYGIEYRSDELTGSQQATPPPFWGSSEQSASVAGIFVQDVWGLSEDLFVSAGIRFDDYEHSTESGVGVGVSNSSSGWSPNLSVEWELHSDLRLRAAYSRAFRGITIREVFFSAIYVHRGDLLPERADNYEVGFSFERGGGFVRGTVFQQNFVNYINAVFDGVTAWGYWENVGDAKAEGYELEVGRQWGQFDVAIGVWETENTINDRLLNDGDLGLGTNIGRTWTARLDYAASQRQLALGLRSRWVEDEPNSIAEGAPDKEGYFVTDVHGSWVPSRVTWLKIQASVNNLLDEFYFDQATYGFSPRAGERIGFPSKGREVVLSAAVGF